MTRLLFSLIGFGVAIGLGVLVMIHGWGLYPVSWGWVVGGGIASGLLGALFQTMD